MGRAFATAVFWLGAVAFGLLFLLTFVTKLTAGDARGYVGMVLSGVGCAACWVAARRPRVSDRQDA